VPTSTTKPVRGFRIPTAIAGHLSLVLLALAIGAAGCARNPVTGRPDAVLTTEKGEIKQGNEAAKIVKEQMGFVPNAVLEQYIDTLGQRLALQSPRTNLVHTFHVVEMKEPNAFALPGGHIYVSRGLLALCNSEDELATVIGHEIGHVAARHSVQRQAANAPLAPVRIAAGLGGAIASIVSPSLGKVVAGVGQLPGALALANYSRDQEREADRLGQQFAAASGFDPMGLSTFMHTLAREEELAGNDPTRGSFFQSHPTSPERSTDAITFAKELEVATDQPAPLTKKKFFFDVLAGIPVGENAAEGTFVDDRFLHPELRIGIRLPQDWKYINTRRALVAQQKDQLAYVILEVADEGSDPMEAALVFDKEVRLDASPRRMEIHGLKAVDAVATVGRGGDRVRLQIAWIAHDGLIYRVMGAASPRDFDSMLPIFNETIGSFHTLSDAELKEINQNTLRISTAGKKEGLEQLSERTGNQWPVDKTEVANGLEAGISPASGALVKIAAKERYVPPPKQEEKSK
jgi:predicted Zn-dependent protease